MKEKLIFCLSTIFVFLLLTSVIVFKPLKILATYTQPLETQIEISTTIGEPKLTVYGWAPADSMVSLTGIGVSADTVSKKDGSFLISKVFLPMPHKNPMDIEEKVFPELCLQAKDAGSRVSQPTCLPSLPAKNYYFEVGPVLVSPTLELEKGETTKGKQIAAKGKITPKTQVQIFLAREKGKGKLSQIVKTANAYMLPSYTIISNEKGEFEFNLPSDSIDKWKVFAAARILDSNSPKSNTLTFSVKSPLFLIWDILKQFFSLIRPYLIYLVIFCELVFITMFLALKRKRQEKVKEEIIVPEIKEEGNQEKVRRKYLEFLKKKSSY